MLRKTQILQLIKYANSFFIHKMLLNLHTCDKHFFSSFNMMTNDVAFSKLKQQTLCRAICIKIIHNFSPGYFEITFRKDGAIKVYYYFIYFFIFCVMKMLEI